MVLGRKFLALLLLGVTFKGECYKLTGTPNVLRRGISFQVFQNTLFGEIVYFYILLSTAPLCSMTKHMCWLLFLLDFNFIMHSKGIYFWFCTGKIERDSHQVSLLYECPNLRVEATTAFSFGEKYNSSGCDCVIRRFLLKHTIWGFRSHSPTPWKKKFWGSINVPWAYQNLVS